MGHLFTQLLGTWDGRLGPQPQVSGLEPAEPQEMVVHAQLCELTSSLTSQGPNMRRPLPGHNILSFTAKEGQAIILQPLVSNPDAISEG